MAKRIETFTHSLETVHQTTIGAVAKLCHDVVKADQIFDINCGLVFERAGLRGGVEVNEVPCAFRGLQVRHESATECGFARAGGPSDEYSIAHVERDKSVENKRRHSSRRWQ